MTGRYDIGFHDYGYVSSYVESKTIANYYRTGYYSGAVVAQNGKLNRRIITPTASATDADNLAKAKLYKSLRQRAVEFSSPTFLGELGETLRMLRKPAAALFESASDLAKALRKGKGKAGTMRAFEKMASGLWLEYSFGWVPLISDTESAARALNRLREKSQDTVVRVKASAKMDYDKTSTLGSYDRPDTYQSFCGSSTMCPSRVRATLKESVIVRYIAGVRSQVEMTTWDKWALFGFTPSEFVPTAWELLPWSFLVDYFVNVGDILSASVTDTKNVIYNVRTVRQQAEYEGRQWTDLADLVSLWPSSSWKNHRLSGSPGNWLYVSRTVNRSKASGAPSLPGLVFKLNQSDGHLGNMAALLAQVHSIFPQRAMGRR